MWKTSVITDDDLFVKKNPVSWLVTASLFAYTISFFLPTYGSQGRSYFFGGDAFGIAFFAFIDGDNVYWLANPSYWCAMALLFCGTTNVLPLVSSIVAFLLASAVCLSFNIGFGQEANKLLPGYYVWLLSFGFAVPASAIELRRYQNELLKS